ncbi:hypothetical protein MSG37_04130 [Shewanella sp. 1CM18E]|nr:hypothetical protein [Shewanella sp. 1CM18E]MCK8044062.1 hypothetical protein [Shewanella sp. 1CM18E]
MRSLEEEAMNLKSLEVSYCNVGGICTDQAIGIASPRDCFIELTEVYFW